MKRGLIGVGVFLAAATAGLGGYYRYGRDTAPPEVTTLSVSRGDIAEIVGATGTIEAVTTVQVALNQANPAEPARGGQQGAGRASGGSGTSAASGTPSAAAAETSTPGLTTAAPPRSTTALPASRDDASNGGQPQPRGPATRQAATGSPAPTVDALFGPLPVTETSGRVWLFIGDRLEPVRVRLGISDGAYTELLAGDLQPGRALVSSVALPARAAGVSTAGRSPLITPGRGTAGGARPTGS